MFVINRRNLLFILLFVSFSLYSFDNTGFILSDEFKKIITIDTENQKIIDNDFLHIDYSKYIDYFIVVSEQSDNRDYIRNWFLDITTLIDKDLLERFGTIDYKSLSTDTKKMFAEELVVFIHNRVLKKYHIDSYTIGEIYSKGLYNCVSSSLFIAIFLLKYGIDTYAVETKDHIFLEVKIDGEEIDIEATNKNGFNPGSKKEVMDQLGEITGFSYVPRVNYRDRSRISLKKAIYSVYHNLSNYYYQRGDITKSVNLSYMIFLGRGDEKGKSFFYTMFKNYLVALLNQKKYEVALNSVNSFRMFFKENYFDNTRFDIIGNMNHDWKDYDNFIAFEKKLIDENEKFIELKNHKTFDEIYIEFVFNVTNYLFKRMSYDEALDLFERFDDFSNHKDKIKILHNILIDMSQKYDDKGDFVYLDNQLLILRNRFIQYSDIINYYERIHFFKKANVLIKNKDFYKALITYKENYEKYSSQKDFLDNYKGLYVNYTVFLYQQGDYENMIKYCEEGLGYFPNDRTLLNNYKSFFQNIVSGFINNKDYLNARKYTNIAFDKFSNDSFFKKADLILKETKN